MGLLSIRAGGLPSRLARLAACLLLLGCAPQAQARAVRVEERVRVNGAALYFHRQPSFPLVLMRGVAGGHIAPWELARFFRGNEVSLEAMNDEALRLDLAASTPAVSVPVIFMLGRHDRQVDSRLAAAYFETLQAPQKRLQWFEESAHNPPFEEPEAFNAALLRLLAQVGAISADGTGGPAG